MRNAERIDQNELVEYDPKIVRLWREFHFVGLPPKKDTPVENRLKDVCSKYIDLVSNDQMLNVPGSDQKRAELHNEISNIVVGRERSSLTASQAGAISDFASVFSTGWHLEELLDHLHSKS